MSDETKDANSLTLTLSAETKGQSIRLDYEREINEKVSLFTGGWAGVSKDYNESPSVPDFGIIGGVRIKF